MELLKVSEVAKLLGIHDLTVRRYADKGKLRAMRDHNNHRWFERDEVLRVKAEIERLRPEKPS